MTIFLLTGESAVICVGEMKLYRCVVLTLLTYESCRALLLSILATGSTKYSIGIVKYNLIILPPPPIL